MNSSVVLLILRFVRRVEENKEWAYANRVQFVKRGKSEAGIAGSNDTLLSSIKSKV